MSGFDDFFRRATSNVPYHYQRRLALADTWPDALEVPTGAGKTAAVVLGWLWRRRFASPAVRNATGRRLVLCLPLRTLTTQAAKCAQDWINALSLDDPPTVYVVMGGAVDDEWLANPDRDTVLVGTQDLLLSRALNRGFAMSRYDWPMAFGLLHNDVQWVFDEVQLMGVGASTSAQLDAFRRKLGAYGAHHSLWMSATLEAGRLATIDRGADLRTLRLEDAEREELSHFLRAKKVVAPLNVDGGNLASVARALLKLHIAGTRTLVVLNQVRRAQDLYKELERTARAVEVALLHSRFRPADRRVIEARVLDRNWSGILVATQVVEAGVDVSSQTLVTDLAPWPSLVQRFGRCNRWGESSSTNIRWIDLPDTEKGAAPYQASDLLRARETLHGLHDGSPESLMGIGASETSIVLPVIRRRDIIDLFDTTPDLAGADIDVSPYIRDGDETDVYIAWRDLHSGERPDEDTPLASRDERCAVPIGAAREFLKRIRGEGEKAWRWDHRLEGWMPVDREVPGQVWLVPSTVGGYSPAIGFTADAANPVPPIAMEGELGEGEGSDARSWARREQTLVEHTQHVVDSLEALIAPLTWIPVEARADLGLSARWHDAGKAHPVFQRTMHGGDANPLRVLAKSTKRRKHARPGFRHEVVSALLLLGSDPDAYCSAYLVAAHHGRARLVVRARPSEGAPPDGRRFALGVWDGDVVPSTDLGDGVRAPETVLRLGIFELGGGGEGMGWTARAAALRDAMGPFRLAALESLLRAADWRGSAIEEGDV